MMVNKIQPKPEFRGDSNYLDQSSEARLFRGESIYLGELSSEVGQLGVLGCLASRWSDLLQVEGWRHDLVDFLKHRQLDFSNLLPFRSPLPSRSKLSL